MSSGNYGDNSGAEEGSSARKLGRMCCGGRTMCTQNESGQWEDKKFIESTEFQGWKCMVNWFFLHIEQGRDLVLHHQTCKAKFDGTTGAIGTLSESDKILEELDQHINSGTFPVISCPNVLCGCGTCVPKAKDIQQFEQLWDQYVLDVIEPSY